MLKEEGVKATLYTGGKANIFKVLEILSYGENKGVETLTQIVEQRGFGGCGEEEK